MAGAVECPSALPSSLLETVLLPVASLTDAKRTCDAATPYLRDRDARVIALHVIDKRRYAPAPSPLSYRRAEAKRLLDHVTGHLDKYDIAATTCIRYGTNVADTILETADGLDVSAIAFTPRGSGRLMKLLTEDVSARLLARSSDPVIVLPVVRPPTGFSGGVKKPES